MLRASRLPSCDKLPTRLKGACNVTSAQTAVADARRTPLGVFLIASPLEYAIGMRTRNRDASDLQFVVLSRGGVAVAQTSFGMGA